MISIRILLPMVVLLNLIDTTSVWRGTTTTTTINFHKKSSTSAILKTKQTYFGTYQKRPSPQEFIMSSKGKWIPETIPSQPVSSKQVSSLHNIMDDDDEDEELWGQGHPWPSSTGNPNYGIIMDAGSTGTRIFVYEWDTPEDCQNSPYIRPSFYTSGELKGKQFKIKKEGGLADIEPELVANYMEDFISSAFQFIPKDKHANTPIFLKATAGMRLLPHFKAQAILTQVRKVFRQSPFLYDPKFGVQIIPGEYEGVFGWLTVNYLAGVLGSKDKPSVGMVDMGGASCQITFETPQVPMENAFPINLNGTSRVVYTHSYLRFGRNEARDRYQSKHFELDTAGTPEDPCFVRGFRGISPSGVEFVGSGDFMSCISKTEHLTLKDPFCPTSSCAINGVYQPSIPDNMEIVGIAGMYKVAKWFKCKGLSSVQCLRDNARDICSNLDFDAYSNRFAKYSDDNDFNNYCFMAAYLVNMLETGYGLPSDRKVRFAKSVRGADVGWTLGAMIYEANLLNPSGQCCR